MYLIVHLSKYVGKVYLLPTVEAKHVDNSKPITLVMQNLESIAPLVRSVEETIEPISTQVQGTVPSWIHGKFLRNGPGKFEFGNTQWVGNTSAHHQPANTGHVLEF